MDASLASPDDVPHPTMPAHLIVQPTPFAQIPRAAWDRLVAATPSATPFARWTFHRAWWDAYGETAHEHYLLCLESDGEQDPGRAPSADTIVAIVPLMHRHEAEPSDQRTATALRPPPLGGTDFPAETKAIFMAASYHADYATILAAPEDLPAVARSAALALGGPPDPAHGSRPWDVVDLRRLRASDPAVVALEAAFRGLSRDMGWQVWLEVEDVCPVVSLETDDWDGYLATLERKARHEIRRKLRRAEAAGDLRFGLLPLTSDVVDRFIALHQARWGDAGLFPDTEGGARSRRFLRRLAELEAGEGDRAQLQLGQASVGDRVIFASVGFDDGVSCYFYNAGMDPSAADLSPGVSGTAAYLRDRLLEGRRRFDFLRGAEPYKYEWGARDEPIRRLLVTRPGGR